MLACAVLTHPPSAWAKWDPMTHQVDRRRAVRIVVVVLLVVALIVALTVTDPRCRTGLELRVARAVALTDGLFLHDRPVESILFRVAECIALAIASEIVAGLREVEVAAAARLSAASLNQAGNSTGGHTIILVLHADAAKACAVRHKRAGMKNGIRTRARVRAPLHHLVAVSLGWAHMDPGVHSPSSLERPVYDLLRAVVIAPGRRTGE